MVHENLRKVRLAKGITQKHLANKLNVSSMAYSRMENGKTKIDVEVLKELAVAMGVDISIFFNNKLTDSVINSMKTKREVG